MSHTTNGLIALTAAVTLAGAPSHAKGQESSAPLSATEEVSAVAVELESQALAMYTATRWNQAARLYRRAAEVRGAGDLKSAENLRTVGYLQYYEDDLEDAVPTLRKAAEAFLALGDVQSAAETFIDGAWVAGRAGMVSEARALRERGLFLTRSPLLDSPDRTALVQRLSRVSFGG